MDIRTISSAESLPEYIIHSLDEHYEEEGQFVTILFLKSLFPFAVCLWEESLTVHHYHGSKR